MLEDLLVPEWEAFAYEFQNCMVCGKPASDRHEIPRGSHREAALSERIAWLRLCRFCHDQLGNYGKWPLLQQYALKALRDVAYYDRVGLNRLRGRAPDAISEQEVWGALPAVLRKVARVI